MEAVQYKAYHRTYAGNKGQTREQAKELKTEGARRSYSAIMAGFLKTFPLLSTRVGISSPENISRFMVVVGYIQLLYKEKSRDSAAQPLQNISLMFVLLVYYMNDIIPTY